MSGSMQDVSTSAVRSEPRHIRESAQWYALSTHPRNEKIVAERLAKLGVEVFCPTYIVNSRRTDRKVTIDAPLFPGYVLTRIKLAEREMIWRVPGICRFITFNGRPAPIDDSEIQAVKRCVESGANVRPHAAIETGQRVRIRNGVLGGIEGFVSRVKGGRVLVLPIGWTHQSVAVQVEPDTLEPVEGIEGASPLRGN